MIKRILTAVLLVLSSVCLGQTGGRNKTIFNAVSSARQFNETRSVDGYRVTFERFSDDHVCGTPHPHVHSDGSRANCPFISPCDDPLNRDATIMEPRSFVIRWVLLNPYGPFSAQLDSSDVYSAMDFLNANFAAYNISFCVGEIVHVTDLAAYDHNMNSEEASLKTTYGQYTSQMINVYTVGDISPGNVAGYARYPFDPGGATSQTGGVVMLESAVNGSNITLTHEIGHTLGLMHTFNGVSEVTPCSNCYEGVDNLPGPGQSIGGDTEGDWCQDTPPHEQNTGSCVASGIDTCSGGLAFNNIPTDNFMSYSNCQNKFTPQQGLRMHCMIGMYLSDWTDFADSSRDIAPVDASVSGLNPGISDVSVDITSLSCGPIFNCVINWSVNNVLQPAYTWADTMYPGEMIFDLVLGNYNFPLGIHEVKIWTSLPNGAIDYNPLNDTLIQNFEICNPLNGQYTVGSSSSYFPTIDSAMNRLYGCGISGPVTFAMEDGIYYHTFHFKPIPGSSSTNTFTLTSLSQDSSLVTFKRYATDTTVNFYLDSVRYVNIQKIGVEVDTGKGFLLYRCVHAHLKGNHIIGTAASNNQFLIYLEGQDTANVIAGNYLKNGGRPISSWGGSNNLFDKLCVRDSIYGNTILEFSYMGISVYKQDSLYIAQNVVQSSIASTSALSIAQCRGTHIIKNKFHIVNSTSSGEGVVDISGTIFPPSESLIANNYITGKGVYGLHINETLGKAPYKIIHNNINFQSNGSLEPAPFCYTKYSSGVSPYQIQIRNNIFVAPGLTYCLRNATGTGFNPILDHNNYYGTLAPYYGCLDASACETGGMQVDPEFISFSNAEATDFMLVEQGLFDPDVADDIHGNPRSNPPSIGANEIHLKNYDAEVVNISGPANPIQLGNHTIEIDLVNLGLIPLTSCDIHWQINNGAVTTFNWSGTGIPFTDTLTSVVIGNHNFTTGDYFITVWTSNPNGFQDENVYNDTLINDFCTPLNGIYGIGPLSQFPDFKSAVDKLIVCGVSGPTTFMIESGTYLSQVSIPIPEIDGAGPSSQITFTSVAGDSSLVTLSYNSSSSPNAGIILDGADHIKFSHVGFYRSNETVLHLTNGANYNSFSHCKFEGSSHSTKKLLRIGTSGTPSAISNNYNTIEHTYFYEGQIAIELINSSSFNLDTGIVVTDNQIENFTHRGVSISGCYDLILSRNKISTDVSASTGLSAGSTYATIEGNSVVLGSGINQNPVSKTGIKVSGVINFYNNSVSLHALASSNGIYVYQGTTASTSSLISNNTSHIYGTGNFKSSAAFLFYTGYQSNNLGIVCNNIGSNMLGGGAIQVKSSIASQLPETHFDKNNWYSNSGFIGIYDNYPTLDTLYTLTDLHTHALDTGSFNVLPGFVSDTDLHIFNYLLANAGNPVSFQTDFEGDIRQITHPDIGADEYSYGVSDLIAYELDTYIDTVCQYKNNLLVDFFCASDTIEANPIVSINVTGPGYQYSKTDTISSIIPGQHYIQDFGYVEFLYAGNYEVVATITHPLDQNSQNDTLYYSIYVDCSTGMSELDENSITAYPNPAKETLYLHNHSSRFPQKISLINVLGEEVTSQDWNPYSERMELSLKGLANGSYFVRCIYENFSFVVKIQVMN